MPRAFCGHMLERFWGYKYHQDSQEDLGHSGINLHADMASINVNFWVGAPQMDHAPADHGGGMKVYLKHVPDSWGFKDYQGPQGKQHELVSNSKSVVVRHRPNRLVIFRSSMPHQTDKLAFRTGYRNRRINLTLLYGIRGGRKQALASMCSGVDEHKPGKLGKDLSSKDEL
eukprot:gnl/TRDRNA2_/TRDRNA2_171104_c1_seq2.p1 gnl/TRDRNA2_/TRDRNA2_171104_c1~~gnl/TRDRNA2_/TRDRNA2_171104_c1_seq2.p1  ORF type:complete len:171 (+),score=17.87 gnl/TRDRNA2_/TRDRNA2_171104_c1_seq2:306-818(+)